MDLPQFRLILQMFHETLAGRMMVDNRYFVLLIRMQDSQIDFDQCLIFPQ